jgi:tRNA pseudouridine55 synthase
LYGIKRVGHTGTLDPAASGLLLIVIGRATRIAPFLTAHDKTYLAGIVFGATSDSGDSDGVITETGIPAPGADRIRQIVAEFVGEIELPVPALASVRSGGSRRYELARAGKDVPEMKRKSTIHSMDLLVYEQPTARIRVRCSSGTYIRALAKAMGEREGCGAYLASLRREAVGGARVEGAYGLDYLAAREALGEELPSPEAVDGYLELPVIEVAADADRVVHHGQPLIPAMVTRITGEFATGADVAISVAAYGVAAVGKALIDSATLRAGSAVASPSQDIGPLGPIGPILSYQCVLI